MRGASIKVFGERNTGTIYLQRLLQLNLDVRVLPGVAPRFLARWFPENEYVRDWYFRLTANRNLGWKHAMAPSIQALARYQKQFPHLLFLTLTKNPYSWLLSLYRHPYHHQGDLGTWEEFLTSPWPTVGRENHKAPFLNPIVMWNEKNRSYLTLGETAPCMNLTYEQVLKDSLALLTELAAKYSLERRVDSFVTLGESTKNEKGKGNDFYQDYYLNERWRSELTVDSISLINQYLDKDVMQRFGYALLT